MGRKLVAPAVEPESGSVLVPQSIIAMVMADADGDAE
jgi:hypothetical protein